MPILPTGNPQRSCKESSLVTPPLEVLVDYSVFGKSVGAFFVPRCTPVFVFSWDVNGNQACAVTETLSPKN